MVRRLPVHGVGYFLHAVPYAREQGPAAPVVIGLALFVVDEHSLAAYGGPQISLETSRNQMSKIHQKISSFLYALPERNKRCSGFFFFHTPFCRAKGPIRNSCRKKCYGRGFILSGM